MEKVLDRKGRGSAVLMDLLKIFVTTSYDLLLAKLLSYGFTNKSLRLIKSYLTNHLQRAKVHTNFSSWSELLLGVHQEPILGPLLFNIYLIDLFYLIECANDITFHACDSDWKDLITRLEHDFLLAIEWFQTNYMKLNEEKCHSLKSGISINFCGQALEGVKFGKVKNTNFFEL